MRLGKVIVWTDLDRRRRRKKLLEHLTVRSQFSEEFGLDDPVLWGQEEEFNRIVVNGGVGFGSTREDFDFSLQQHLGMRLNDIPIVDKLAKDRPDSMIFFELLLYRDEKPLEGWAKATVYQKSSEYSSLETPMLVDGRWKLMSFEDEWLDNEGEEYEKAEKKKTYFSALCTKVDDLLSIIEEKLIERSERGHGR